MKKIVSTAALLITVMAAAQQKKQADTLSEKEIKEVVLEKKAIQKKADRLIFDVAATPMAKGNTAFNILKQTPLVSSTDDKTLKIVGKNNVVIYINGRKTTMNADALVEFLKNTPADNIQKIEVITVPGSEYNVESSDGIINIVLKKKPSDGINGNLKMTNETSYWNNPSASASINIRKGKLGVNASLMTSDYTGEQNYLLKNGNQSGNNISEGHVTDPNKNIGGYLNMDYELNDKSNLALSWNNWNNKSYGSKINLFNTVNESSYNWSKNNEDSKSYNNSINLNYELKTDSLGSKLNLNAAYLNYRRFQNADNRTYLSDAHRNILDLARQNLQNTPQIINNFSFLADYIQKFDKEFTLAFGGNFNKTKTDNNTQTTTTNFLTNTTEETPNHFVYNENIYGIYLTLEKKFSDQFSGKIGSRYEITDSEGTSDNAQNPEMKDIKRNYKNFLPYLSFNYAINDKNNISYAFSSRVRRPGFWELNPVINYLTDVNYIQNNPFVKASSTYTNELTYMYNSSYFLVLSHSYFKDVITQVPLQGVINGINQLRYIRTNFGNKQEMSAVLGMNKSLFKGILNTNFNIGVQHNINNGTLTQDPISGDIFPQYVNTKKSTSIMVQTNNTIRLDKAKTWFLGINYWFVDKQQIELGQLQSLGSLDLNLKKIWNNWTFTAEIDDLLRTNVVEFEDNQANGNYNYGKNDSYRRSFTLSISYNFGNKKVQKIRNIDSAVKDIKSRTN